MAAAEPGRCWQRAAVPLLQGTPLCLPGPGVAPVRGLLARTNRGTAAAAGPQWQGGHTTRLPPAHFEAHRGSESRHRPLRHCTPSGQMPAAGPPGHRARPQMVHLRFKFSLPGPGPPCAGALSTVNSTRSLSAAPVGGGSHARLLRRRSEARPHHDVRIMIVTAGGGCRSCSESTWRVGIATVSCTMERMYTDR